MLCMKWSLCRDRVKPKFREYKRVNFTYKLNHSLQTIVETVYHQITGPMKKLARLVGHGNTSIANFIFKHLPLKNKVLKVVQNVVSTETNTICSDRHKSIVHDKSQHVLDNFSLEPLWSELSTTAPVLLSILKGWIRKKADPEHTKPIICTCAAILLKLLHNTKLCQFRPVISLLLHAGHASKQVISQLQ